MTTFLADLFYIQNLSWISNPVSVLITIAFLVPFLMIIQKRDSHLLVSFFIGINLIFIFLAYRDSYTLLSLIVATVLMLLSQHLVRYFETPAKVTFIITSIFLYLIARAFEASQPEMLFIGLGYLLIKIIETIKSSQTSHLQKITYLTLWLPLAGGPIYQLKSFEQDLKKRQVADINHQILRATIGAIKLLILAKAVNLWTVYFKAQDFGYWSKLFFVYLNFIKIYLQFSGATDITIAIGRMFGLHFPENFNRPFFAQNLSDFWSRWHMSLTEWLRANVFFPLLASLLRKQISSTLATTICYASVSFSMALLHGMSASWIAYGAWNFFGFVIQDLLHRFLKERTWSSYIHPKIRYFLQSAFTITFISIGFLLMDSIDLFIWFMLP